LKAAFNVTMPPFTRPEIPERYSSLLSSRGRDELHEIKKRKVSVLSQISVDSTIEEFVQAKEASIKIDLELVGTLRDGLKSAYKNKTIGKTAFREAMTELDEGKRAKLEELIVHKRQRKVLTEDIEEHLPLYASMENAYTNVLVNKVMLANSKQRRPKFEQSEFRAAVEVKDALTCPYSPSV
jgi:hypothetical protein